MSEDSSKLPPHVQAKIAGYGQTLADHTQKVENVNPQSGPPTDWQSPGYRREPEPQYVDPITPEQPKR
jgi:hypothetical protein